MARPTQITQRQIDFIEKATLIGMSSYEIGKEIGMSYKTVQRYIIKYNFNKPIKQTLTFK